jgi:UDP-N-acetylmuramoyl-tripeptide--D-alanyl-D-alanine ligase
VEIGGVSTDTRTLRPGELFVAICGPIHDGHDFLDQAAARGAAALLVSRSSGAPGGIPRIEVVDTVLALGEMAREYRRRFPGPVIAITGSNGKTTTKEMCAEILAAAAVRVRRSPGNLNNAIGLPLSVFALEEGDEILVVELGMNRPGEIDALGRIAEPTVGAITQVARAHLEGLGSIEAVARAKAEILGRIAKDGIAVLCADDPRVAREAARYDGRKSWFGLEKGAEFRAIDLRAEGPGTRFRLQTPYGETEARIALPGRHLVLLAACAAACAFATERLAATDLAAVAAGLEAFRGVPGRLRLVRGPSRITVLDDTYNANPSSCRAALRTLKEIAGQGRAIAVLGDMLELGEAEDSLHAEVGEEAGRLGIDVVLAVGSRSERTADGARRAGVARVEELVDAGEAARVLDSLLQPGDTVLVKGSRGMRMERALHALIGEAD